MTRQSPLFCGMGIDLQLSNALAHALAQVDQVAAADRRMVTRVCHTVILLRGNHPTVKGVFEAVPGGVAGQKPGVRRGQRERDHDLPIMMF